ncbi:hypothetical protein K788_00005505 [Paraburkholderia caribensis MBA4]|uniref:Uncharacterized protein n=1 Tax=Paraburkholderia caribensis MBA4 TaxID=1323664 RepID=A0A0P0RH18_9BURK|nr:hypothetical protein K788_00005505 [Paraburkholderia caribensis MBA4]
MFGATAWRHRKYFGDERRTRKLWKVFRIFKTLDFAWEPRTVRNKAPRVFDEQTAVTEEIYNGDEFAEQFGRRQVFTDWYCRCAVGKLAASHSLS